MRFHRWIGMGALICLHVALSGCTLIDGFFRSSDAIILAFEMDGLTEPAAIDTESNTVSVSVQPMDISAAVPVVTVSEGASIDMATMIDGEAVSFTVQAEDGTIVTWSVTATVQHGISFSYGSGPTDIVMVEGVIDSTDPANGERHGNGVSLAGFSNSGTQWKGWALEEPLDAATATGNPQDSVILLVYSNEPGTFDGTQAALSWGEDDLSATFDSDSADPDSLTLNVLQLGEVGEDIVGTFEGVCQQNDGTSHTVSDGFFKLLRVEDDLVS